MLVKAIHSIGHAGELHPPGSVLDIPEEEVERLLGLGAVALVEPTPKATGKKERGSR